MILLDTKIEDVASGLVPYCGKVALSNKENALNIISYIHVMRTEAIYLIITEGILSYCFQSFQTIFKTNYPSKR
jgi:hypothetical protein